MLEYPKEFSSYSIARVEKTRLEASISYDENPLSAWDRINGYAGGVSPLIRYIAIVVTMFGYEACELGKPSPPGVRWRCPLDNHQDSVRDRSIRRKVRAVRAHRKNCAELQPRRTAAFLQNSWESFIEPKNGGTSFASALMWLVFNRSQPLAPRHRGLWDHLS